MRVLIIDDSATARQALCDVFRPIAGVVVSAVPDAEIGLFRIKRERPSIVILDLELPGMSGLAALDRIVREHGVPVVVCSSHVGPGRRETVVALERGAVDVIDKSEIRDGLTVVERVLAAAQAKPRPRAHLTLTRPVPLPQAHPARPSGSNSNRPAIIAIGASTGGTDAIRTVLEGLGPATPGVVIVQHMPPKFTAAFAHRLDEVTPLHVKEAAGGDIVRPGHALVAPGGRHLLVYRRGGQLVVELSDDPPVNRHRPSVDVLFRSVASAGGSAAVGVILTGMGDDGAAGLAQLRAAGGRTMAQDEASCVVFGMPKAAIACGAVGEVVTLEAIAARLARGPRAPASLP